MNLNTVVPWGRSLEEYIEIFSLSEQDLAKSILGCGDGPASFNAQLTQRGGYVTSLDPTYCFTAEQLQGRINEVYHEVMPQMRQTQDKYLWTKIHSVEQLGTIRMSAMKVFIEDYPTGKAQGRYVEGALPQLPFKTHQFELALCSHFLFLYSEQVSFSEHLASLEALCRVANEVRVYPLVALDGQLSPHLDKVMSALVAQGYEASPKEVAYRFQKGATHMLVVKQR